MHKYFFNQKQINLSKNQIKILIADDEAQIIEQIVQHLISASSNYQILADQNGQALYEIASHQLPDIILTDWDMPNLNGIQALEKLQTNPKTAEIPVVMITGAMTSPQNLKLALDAGAIDFLGKPFNEVELIARINSALRTSFAIRTQKKQRQILENALNYYNLQVITKNQVLTDLQYNLEMLAQQPEQMQDLIIAMKIKIKQNLQSDKEWKNFCRIFEAVHPDFFTHLETKYPQITNKERNLCALVRLGLDTNEITQILGISAQGVRTAIYRIGKKMQLSDKIDPRIYIRSL